MPNAGHTVSTSPAGHMTFTRNQFAWTKIVHIGADLNDLANKLMTNDHRHRNRFFGPVIPIVDVYVRAANAGAQHADQNIVDSDTGLRNVLQPQSLFRMRLDESLHQRPQLGSLLTSRGVTGLPSLQLPINVCCGPPPNAYSRLRL